MTDGKRLDDPPKGAAASPSNMSHPVGLELRDFVDVRLISLLLLGVAILSSIVYNDFFFVPPNESSRPTINDRLSAQNLLHSQHLQSSPNFPSKVSLTPTALIDPRVPHSSPQLPPSERVNSTVTIDGHTLTLSLLSRDPQMLLIYNFLSPSECDALIELGVPLLEPSFVSELGTGQKTYTEGRTSYTHHFPHLNHSLITTMEKRLAHISGLPLAHSAGVNFLRYRSGEFFALHYDSKPYHRKLGADGMRVYSNLVYLNDIDVETQGGDTYFPYLNISIRPIKGLSLFWGNINEFGEMDERMLHEGRPPNYGEKFTVNMFIKEGMGMNALRDAKERFEGGLPIHEEIGVCQCDLCKAYPWTFFDSNYKPFWGEKRAWMTMEHTSPLPPWNSIAPNKKKYYEWLAQKDDREMEGSSGRAKKQKELKEMDIALEKMKDAEKQWSDLKEVLDRAAKRKEEDIPIASQLSQPSILDSGTSDRTLDYQ